MGEKKSRCKTFDELRYFNFKFKCSQIENLPATSNSILLHIKRAFYVVYTQINCLNRSAKKLNMLEFGFVQKGENIVPEKIITLNPPPEELVMPCNCKVCGTKSCHCNKTNLPCVSFCACMKLQTCKNQHNVIESCIN